jgi:PAS domain S-box-containing protein
VTVSVLYARPGDARDLDLTATGLDASVTTVHTERAAREAIQSSAFDCAVAHQHLDAGTGLGVLADCREERPRLPFVLCSAEPDGELASEATRYDVSAYHVLGGEESVEERLAALLDDPDDDGTAPARALFSDGASMTHGTAFSSIADTLNAAVVTIDVDSTIHFANDELASLTGYDADRLVGDSFTKLMPERFEAAHEAGIEQYARTRERTVDWDYIELAVEHREGHEIPVAVSFAEFERDDEIFFTGVIRDIREEKSQARALQQLHEVSSDPDLTTMEKIRSVLDDHRKRLDLDVAFLSRIEDGTERLVAAVGDHPLVEEGADYPLEDTYCQHTIESDEPIIVTNAAEATALDESVYDLMGAACYVGETVTVGDELYGTLCFVADAETDREFDDADIAFLELLTDWVGYELQQAEQREQLRTERQRVETILDRVDDAFFAVDENWNFTYFNRRAEEVLGKSAEEVMGENIWEEFAPAVGSTFDEKYHEAMETQEQVTFEEYYPPMEQWFQVSAYPSDDGLSVYFSDVTERRKYTQSLSALLEQTQKFATDTTAEAVAETVLTATGEVFGCPVGAVRRLDPEKRVLRPLVTTAEAKAVSGGRPVYDADSWGPGEALRRGETVVLDDVEARARAEENGPRPDAMADLTAAMFVPIGEEYVLSLGATGPSGFDETTQSLAELLAAHAALAFERVEREQDLRTYETVLESLEGMVYALDADEQLTLVTDPLAEWLGYDREDLVGADPSVVMDEAEIERFRSELQGLRAADERSVRLETELTAADGSRLPAETEISTAYATDAFDGTIGVVRDRSELQAARQQLETERDRFSYLYDNIPDAVVDVVFEDGVPVVEATNDAFEDVFGYDSDAVVGTPIDEYLVPDSMATDTTAFYDAVAGMEQWSGELRRQTANGLRYFLFRGIPYRGADGTLHGFGIYTDITERKQRARRLQVLTRVLRHNLRNDLAILLGYAEMLREDIEDERLREVAGSVCDRIHEISDLSEEVRAVQETLGDTTPPSRAVDAADYIHSLVADCTASTAASPVVDVPGGLTLRVDERLDLVVENLVENAVEHAGATPHVEVRASATGDTLVLTVADDGPGIPDLEWDVVTGETEITQLSHGSGLGLWTVKWVADSYGGQIRRVPTDLGGAAIEVRLPGLVD